MQTIRKNNPQTPPKLSLILLDWSVRESFHVLDYLNHQRIDRASYEIIWIEYYNRRSPELDQLIKKYKSLDLPPPVDTWIIMENPEGECYHKHKMYNLGILEARGEIVVIMDSDAAVKTTFIETMIEEFKNNPKQVVHLEQIRNFDRKYYPFNYPTLGEITGHGCVNAIDGVAVGDNLKQPDLVRQPKSLKKDWNLWHVYNYGACFLARREDLIRIGGSDEHVDYLGHICGPYEMTARLINAGLSDQLHPSHWVYHCWHPNTGGTNNYCGPNNGKGMSTTAMEIPNTGRIQPLVENENIKKLRLTLEETAHVART